MLINGDCPKEISIEADEAFLSSIQGPVVIRTFDINYALVFPKGTIADNEDFVFMDFYAQCSSGYGEFSCDKPKGHLGPHAEGSYALWESQASGGPLDSPGSFRGFRSINREITS